MGIRYRRSRATGAAVDLTVIVVSFNVRPLLERALASVVADGASLDTEVVVVDNASDDGSAAAVRDAFPEVTVIANPDNRYFTGANNQGLGMARGRYVLLLNPDTEVRPGTLPAVVEALDRRPGVGLASCRMLWPDGRVQHNCCAERTMLSLVLEHTVLGLVLAPWRARVRAREWYRGWDRESEREVGVLPGGCLLVPRRVLERVGGLDEGLRLYFAEDEWCRRMRAAGLGVRYLPIGGVVHLEGASVRLNPRRARRIYFSDLRRYASGRFGRLPAGVLAGLAWPLRRGLDLQDTLRGGR